jgi:hypothetical protein
MVVFMLVCLPLVWAALFAGTTDHGDIRITVRNPMIAGAAAFPIFLMIEFAAMPAYPPYHILAESFVCYAIYVFLFPLALGAFLFFMLFRRRLGMPREQLMLCFRSFMSSFLFLLACHDLVQNISRLSAVELFMKPLLVVSLMILISRAVAYWRENRRILIIEIGILAIAQILAALGMALFWVNLPLPGILAMAPVFAAALARSLHPWRWPRVAGAA